MVFSIILISIFVVGLVITGIIYNYENNKRKDMIFDIKSAFKFYDKFENILIVGVLFFIGILISILGLISGLCNKTEFINTYEYCKMNSQYVTDDYLANINKEIFDINTCKGTIFSFYNDTDLEPFVIDNVSNKIIIQK